MQGTTASTSHRRATRCRPLQLLLSCLPVACAMAGLACSGRSSEDREPREQAATAVQAEATPAHGERELVVFAAASLRNAFEALAGGFRRSHEGVELIFNFAGSQELRTQIEHGAPADVFASADVTHMESLAREGLARPAVRFARNRLVVIVPAGATAVQRLQDLPAARRIVIGSPDVPIGRYTRQMLARATATWPGFEERVMAQVASQELNVRQILAKIALGEGDAAIVYRTDAAAAPDKVDVIPIPAELDVVAEYPIAVLARARHPGLAQAWVEYVQSPAGQAVLVRAGFEPPAPPGETERDAP
jgi:molybdate transport system substrate-binding protein